jgi:murein DD-endopeptidase MepM/ murein hydrolase activator NlpD
MSRPALFLLLLVGLPGCRVEPISGAPDPDPDSTLASGSYDREPAAALRPSATEPDSEQTDGAPIPSPTPVNPPTADRAGTPPPTDRRLLLPVEGVTRDDLTDTFTDARAAGRPHNAIDIMAPRGRAVYAAVGGEVLRLFTSERGGLTVYQLGPAGRTVYYYAHLDAYQPGLADGQALAQGDLIGTVGDSGNAAPGNTHLHFAMWRVDDPAQFWDGEPVNPYPLLTGE